MRDALGSALIIGIVLTLAGMGVAFAQLAFAVLALVLIIALILAIFNLTNLRDALLPVITAALAVGFIPVLVTTLIQNVWQLVSASTVFFIVLLLLVIAFFLSGVRR